MLDEFLNSEEYQNLLTNSVYDNCLVQSDYSANEVRWLTICSGDPVLAEQFNKAKAYRDEYRKNPTPELKIKAGLADIHKITASLMYGVPLEEVTSEMREATKTIVFGLFYGRYVKSIAKQLGKTPHETQRLLDKFIKSFSRGNEWLIETEEFSKNHLY